LEAPFSVLSLKDFKKDISSFSEDLGVSFKKSGFCGIEHHGIDTSLVSEVQDMLAEFFSFSKDYKMNFYRP
jgi:isopenicillin N synthase-like dioxygenase